MSARHFTSTVGFNPRRLARGVEEDTRARVWESVRFGQKTKTKLALIPVYGAD